MAYDPLRPWPKARPWIWAGLAGLAIATQGPSFVRAMRPGERQGVDFFQEWASARNVLTGAPAYMSQALAMERYLGLTPDLGDPQFIAHNAHPPSSILLVLPLASLDYRTATLAWNVLSLACITASVGMVVRGLGMRLPLWSVFPALVLGLTCGPLRQTVNQGQLNGVLLALLTGAWAADRRGRACRAGALVGIATAIKLFPGFVLIYFVARRRWKSVTAWAAAMTFVSSLTIAVVGIQAYLDYARTVVPSLTQFQSDWGNASLAGFFVKLFNTGAIHFGHAVTPLVHAPVVAKFGTLVGVVCVAAFVGRAASHARTTDQGDGALALALCGMLLVSPIAWDHYFVLLLLPLVRIWRDLPEPGGGKALAFGLILLLTWVNPLQVWSLGLPDPTTRETWIITRPGALIGPLSYLTYALVILFSWTKFEGSAGRRQASTYVAARSLDGSCFLWLTSSVSLRSAPSRDRTR